MPYSLLSAWQLAAGALTPAPANAVVLLLLAGVSTLASGLTLTGVLWLFKGVSGLREDNAGIRAILTTNTGEVATLRTRSHEHGDVLQVHAGKIELHEFRLLALDRRMGPDDRRAPT